MTVIVTEALVFCAADTDHAMAHILRRGGDTYDVQPLIHDGMSVLGEPILFDANNPNRSVGGNFATYQDAIDAAEAYCGDLDKNAVKEIQNAGVVADLRKENESLKAQLQALGK